MDYDSSRLTCALASLILALLVSAGDARAGTVITFEQVGTNVVETGSGAIDLTGLTFGGTTSGDAGTVPSLATTVLGPPSNTADSYYKGVTGPSSFGTGTESFPNTGTGDRFGVSGALERLEVPSGYVSGSALSATDTYANTNFNTLGLTPGTYTYTWGAGSDQSVTVQILSAAVPEPSTAILAAIGAVAVGTYGWFHRRRHQRRQVSA